MENIPKLLRKYYKDFLKEWDKYYATLQDFIHWMINNKIIELDKEILDV